MTIDEAIAKNRSYAKLANDRKKGIRNREVVNMQTELANYHSQIAEWLEELKAIKNGFTDDLLNMGFTKGYRKAIDDFISTCVSCGIVGLSTFHDMSLIAEQLKDGGANDNL